MRRQFEALSIAQYPTPIWRAAELGVPHLELWVKNDGVLQPDYGGNKVRKLEFILADAQRRGARRLLTAGAAGSHQGLATALFGRRAGFSVAAVLCPQPWSEHAERTLRAALAQGLEPLPVTSFKAVPAKLLRVLRRDDYFVPIGGSGFIGTLGFIKAVAELADQIRRGMAPEPDYIVAPLGSGGTVAGLLAGVVASGLGCQIIGVDVSGLRLAAAPLVLGLAHRASTMAARPVSVRRLSRQLRVDHEFLGPGYGHSTVAGAQAANAARSVGLELDPTYTAKAFAKVLQLTLSPNPIHRKKQGPLRVLYWHTLSAVPLEPLLRSAPPTLPASLSNLFARG